MVNGIVDVKSQFLEVGDDDQPRAHMLALVAESLSLDFREIGGLVVFQFDDPNNLLVQQDSTVGFLAVGLVLLFRYQVEAWRWIERIAQHFHEQFAEKALLELFLFRLTYVLLYLIIQKVTLILLPSCSGHFLWQ